MVDEREEWIASIGEFNLDIHEVAVGIVFEGWKYTPEETKDIGQINVP